MASQHQNNARQRQRRRRNRRWHQRASGGTLVYDIADNIRCLTAVPPTFITFFSISGGSVPMAMAAKRNIKAATKMAAASATREKRRNIFGSNQWLLYDVNVAGVNRQNQCAS